MSTQLKERPIIFTAEEVNAVLAGDKTQHRVPIEESNDTAILFDGHEWRYDGKEFIEDACCDPNPRGKHYFEQIKRIGNRTEFLEDYRSIGHCPLGKVGDQLWVQEDHRPVNWSFDDGEVTIEYRDGTTNTPHYLTDEEFETNPNDDYPFAVVDELLDRNIPLQAGRDCFDFSNSDNLPHWRNADVMPIFASRLLLEITDIRIERVQDTKHADAVAEGVRHFDIEARLRDQPLSVAQIVFSRHWDTKHQDRDTDWESNPWVWVIEFEKVDD